MTSNESLHKSSILNNLRLEQEHYKLCNPERYAKIKEIADYIELLENENKEMRDILIGIYEDTIPYNEKFN